MADPTEPTVLEYARYRVQMFSMFGGLGALGGGELTLAECPICWALTTEQHIVAHIHTHPEPKPEPEPNPHQLDPAYEWTVRQTNRKGYAPPPPDGDGWEEVPELFERDDFTDNYMFKRLKPVLREVTPGAHRVVISVDDHNPGWATVICESCGGFVYSGMRWQDVLADHAGGSDGQ